MPLIAALDEQDRRRQRTAPTLPGLPEALPGRRSLRTGLRQRRHDVEGELRLVAGHHGREALVCLDEVRQGLANATAGLVRCAGEVGCSDVRASMTNRE